jgi:hypothetical protein
MSTYRTIKQRFEALAKKEAAELDRCIALARAEYELQHIASGDLHMKAARKHAQRMLAALDCAKACGPEEAE